MTDTAAQRILRAAETIAVVGCSRDPAKEAHSVPAALQAAGFRIVPINPVADELLGEPVYHALDQVPMPIDVVEVFRPSKEAAALAREAVAVGAGAVWLQQGITSAEAKTIAEQANLGYVEDQCMAVVRALAGITKPVRPR